jgi:DNA invertase Pin-like site-specific DNA recombinase
MACGTPDFRSGSGVDQRSGTYVLQKSYAEQRLCAISFARPSGPGMKPGYARVSTEDQRLEIQRARLTGAGCGRLFEEKISGAARQRPALERLLEELRAEDILVVTRLDRLARSTSELLRLAEVIAGKDAGLQSLEEPWADTTTPAGRMVLTVFAGVAEFERALIRHRTDEGRRAAKRRGVSFGRPRKLRPDQKALALALVQEGRSISEVARTFNVHPATIHRCLNAPQASEAAL